MSLVGIMIMFTSHSLKLKADILFWYFEQNLFQNSGNYPRKTNLVLEFADFISNATQQDLECCVTFESKVEFLALKKLIDQGIDAWLDSDSIKTLLLR